MHHRNKSYWSRKRRGHLKLSAHVTNRFTEEAATVDATLPFKVYSP